MVLAALEELALSEPEKHDLPHAKDRAYRSCVYRRANQAGTSLSQQVEIILSLLLASFRPVCGKLRACYAEDESLLRDHTYGMDSTSVQSQHSLPCLGYRQGTAYPGSFAKL